MIAAFAITDSLYEIIRYDTIR